MKFQVHNRCLIADGSTCIYPTGTYKYIVDELADVVVVSITSPCSIVCASMKCFYVLERCTTRLKIKTSALNSVQ